MRCFHINIPYTNVDLVDPFKQLLDPTILGELPHNSHHIEKLAMELLEIARLHTVGDASYQNREHWFRVSTICLALASQSKRLLEALLELHPALVWDVDIYG